jgi:hypothetical protein
VNDSESTQVQYASFLVRLWRSGPSAPEGYDTGWQGEVEHIQSGRRTAFASLGELCELLCHPLRGAPRSDPGKLLPCREFVDSDLLCSGSEEASDVYDGRSYRGP